jgi:hypothetical protein
MFKGFGRFERPGMAERRPGIVPQEALARLS